MNKELQEKILQKLGLSEVPSLDLSGLSKIYEAWCESVPFDNSRKLIHVSTGDSGPLPGDSTEDFFDAWLKYSTGGTCWAANGALHDLLLGLGYSACRGVATMLVAPNVPPNHGTVVVGFDGAKYLVDASITHRVPILLDANVAGAKSLPSWVNKVEFTDSHWHIHWRPLHRLNGIDCRVDYLQAEKSEFSERHEKTRIWSPFNFELNIHKVKGDSMIGIAEGGRANINGNGEILCVELSLEDRNKYLIEELGVSEEIVTKLPLDQKTPPPPWSRTAQGLEH